MTTVKSLEVCDSCSDCAYDMGIDTWEEQIELMVEMGSDVADHICETREEQDLAIQCHCECNPKRFEWHRNQRRQQTS